MLKYHSKQIADLTDKITKSTFGGASAHTQLVKITALPRTVARSGCYNTMKVVVE